MQAREKEHVDLRRLFAMARPWYPVAVACVLLAAGTAYVVSTVQQKTYESSATVIVGQALSAANPDFNQLLVSQRLSATYALIATTSPVLEAVISNLGLQTTPDVLRERIRASAQPDSSLMTISAQDPDPAQAASIANAVAEELVAASPAIQGRQAVLQASVDAELDATQVQLKRTQARAEALSGLTDRTPEQDAELAALEGRLVSLRSTYAALLSFSSGGEANLLSIIEPAVVSDDPVSPRPLLNTLLGAVLGLALAVGIAAVLTYVRDAIRDPDDVQEVADLSTLGSISLMKGDRAASEVYRLAALLYPRSGIAEAYRMLRANIEFAVVDEPLRTLLVTGSAPGEGKTVTAANLAVVFAQAGRRVLLVDADLRKPGIHVMFGLPNTRGLTTLLLGPAVDGREVIHATEEANLQVMTSGPLPPNPAELLGSQRMREVLGRLAAGVDLVVLDSPPLTLVTDSAILSAFVDGTLLVIDARHSHRRTVQRGCEALDWAGATVLGAVLNRVPGGADSDYGGYYQKGPTPESAKTGGRVAGISSDGSVP